MTSQRRAERERRLTDRENLYRAILAIVAQRPDGTPIDTKDLASAGQRAAINRALADLVEHGRLVRVGRGLYARPIATRLGKSAPPIEQVVFTVAQQRGETVAVHGSTAAYNLGLTIQPPLKSTYLTSGRNRRATIGDQAIEFLHASAWQIDIPVRRAGNVIRALAWLGPEKGEVALGTLEKRLPPEAIDELAAANRNLPDWLSALIAQLVDALKRRAA
ncbi:MAG TPA: DUF6088 family protein [Magnetospirillaceae bacterium]|jgi:hypothetical protein